MYAELKGKHSQPPVSLMGQLLWREFYYLAGHGVPRFDKMEGNPICKQIPWGRSVLVLVFVFFGGGRGHLRVCGSVDCFLWDVVCGFIVSQGCC